MAAYGERKPNEGQAGMAMSMYIHEDELAMLDEVRALWGLKRNPALRRMIVEIHQQNVQR